MGGECGTGNKRWMSLDIGNVVSDVVVAVGSGCRIRGWGSRCGELDGVRGLLDHCCGFWGGQVRSVEQMTRFDKRVFSSLCNSILRAVVCLCMLFSAW